MPTTYIQRSTTSDLAVPGEYDRKLLEDADTVSDLLIALASSQTKTGYSFTEPGIPGASGVSGDYTVEVDIAAGDTSVQISAAVARVNSSGVEQATSAFTAEQVAAGAVLTFTFTNPSLGTWASGDRLRVAVRYRNSHAHTGRDVTVSFNTTEAQVVAPWTAAPTSTSVARISLAPGDTPASDTDHAIHVRARTTSGATGTIRAALYEGASNRSGDLESSALTTSLADYVLPISEANAANITDYSNLEIRLWGYDVGGGALVFEVAELSLVAPAGAPATVQRRIEPVQFVPVHFPNRW